MATLTLTSKDPADVRADVLVLGIAADGSGARLLGGDRLPPAVRRALTEALPLIGATGAVDGVHRIPVAGLAARAVALTGLGKVRGRPTPEALRRAAGAAVRGLNGVKRIAVALPTADVSDVAAVAEGALLGAYSYTRYLRPDDAKAPVGAVVVSSPHAAGGAARAAGNRARILAAAVHGTRDLVNAAPVDLYPESFAREAVSATEELPVTVTVLDEKKLARGGFGGLLGVGMGSSRPPRLVRLDYAPGGSHPHLALVGKGITFDSGGLSIKPAQAMEWMKSDMSGAAAVLHATLAAARLALPLRITGYLALAENMPSATAQRPSDVLTLRGGKTVEVLNTDAEGRLVLADALVAASELDPDLIVDVATLTGAQMVALGSRVSAIMSNDDDLRERVHRIADQVGEQFWPMPLPVELRASMDSRVADIANMGDRYGGMLVAGLFLQEFLPRNDADGPVIPWAHLDIAGPAFNLGGAHGYTPSGGTGVAVRTLVGLAEDLSVSQMG